MVEPSQCDQGFPEAPLDAVLADAPGGRAVWIRTADGLRLRVGQWDATATGADNFPAHRTTGAAQTTAPKARADDCPTIAPRRDEAGVGGPLGPDPGCARSRGTVLLFPGRTEYIEKYGPTAADLAARGYGVVVIDWRGQGLSDRLLPDPAPGHVDAFADYQSDVAALVGFARARSLPQPWFLLAHSMGGAIGLRALIGGLPVRAVAFSAPMWGIELGRTPQPLVRALAAAAQAVGLGTRIAPGSSRETLVLTGGFGPNLLTSCPARYDWLRAQATARPDLVLGGPSLRWVSEALAECRALDGLPSPIVPALTGLGADEGIVSSDAIRARMARWPGGRLTEYPAARHELLMERDSIRDRFIAEIDDLFRAA